MVVAAKEKIGLLLTGYIIQEEEKKHKLQKESQKSTRSKPRKTMKLNIATCKRPKEAYTCFTVDQDLSMWWIKFID